MIPIKLAIPALLLTLLQALQTFLWAQLCKPHYWIRSWRPERFVIRAYQPNSNYVNLVNTLLIAGGAAVITASNERDHYLSVSICAAGCGQHMRKERGSAKLFYKYG